MCLVESGVPPIHQSFLHQFTAALLHTDLTVEHIRKKILWSSSVCEKLNTTANDTQHSLFVFCGQPQSIALLPHPISQLAIYCLICSSGMQSLVKVKPMCVTVKHCSVEEELAGLSSLICTGFWNYRLVWWQLQSCTLRPAGPSARFLLAWLVAARRSSS